MAAALSAYIQLFRGCATLPCQLSADSVRVVTCGEDLPCLLDQQPSYILFNSVCVVDLCTCRPPSHWRLEDDHSALRPTELLVRYPEIYWIFLISGKPNIAQEIDGFHFVCASTVYETITLLRRHLAGFRPLYDPTGFRQHVMRPAQPNKSYSTWGKGISVEDEISYCMLNGYFLYRNRISTYLAPTKSEFLQAAALTRARGQTWHVIEDVELQYPDSNQNDPLHHKYFMPRDPASAECVEELLEERATLYCYLNTRTVISSLRVSGTSPSNSCQMIVVTKPYSGFYDKRIMPSTVTAPSHKVEKVSPDGPSAHSAPGAHQRVATHVIRRAKRTMQQVPTTEDALQVAVLASVAESLLEHRTAHMALDALSIRHRMEATAECMFIGTSNKLDVKSRIDDIRRSVDATVAFSPWEWRRPFRRLGNLVDVKAAKRRKQRSNAMLEICGDLRDVYQEYDQLNEEEKLLIHYRRWERRVLAASTFERRGKLFSSSNRALVLLRFLCGQIVQSFRAYFNLALRGWVAAILLCLFWIVVFAWWYEHIANPLLPACPPAIADSALAESDACSMHAFDLRDYFLHSAVTFVSLQPLDAGPTPSLVSQIHEKERDNRKRAEVSSALHSLWSIMALELATGYFHLAIFITLFLQRYSKK